MSTPAGLGGWARRNAITLSALAACVAVLVPFLRSGDRAVADVGEPVMLTRFANGRVDVRSGPGAGYEAINYFAHEQPVLVGPEDPNGWAPVLDPVGDTIGFVWAASLMERLPPGGHQELEGLVVPPR